MLPTLVSDNVHGYKQPYPLENTPRMQCNCLDPERSWTTNFRSSPAGLERLHHLNASGISASWTSPREAVVDEATDHVFRKS